MSDRERKSVLSNIFTIGTPECAIFFAVAAMVLGLLILTIGFWKALLVAVLMLIGGFLGGVKNKKQWLKNVINRLFPARSIVPYREQNPEIARAVRKATEAPKTDEAEAQPAPEAEETAQDQPKAED